jgi:hypothetical protein
VFRFGAGRHGEVAVRNSIPRRIPICFAGAASCLLAAVAPGAAQQAGFPVGEDGFRPVRIAPGLSRGDDVIDVLAPLLARFPGEDEGRPHVTLEMERIDGNVVFDLIETGFADDSVAGEHHRGVIVRSGTGWKMIDLAVRPICARGSLSRDGRCP